ncbi:MAG: hypothetical protein ACE5OZ_22600 [Candidatus Heimdallarchaeota archaeon]
MSDKSGVAALVLHLRLWEWNNTGGYWISPHELNWTTVEGSSEPLAGRWYELVPPSWAGSRQKLDFLISTADKTLWKGDLRVQIAISADFLGEGWITDPRALFEWDEESSPGETSPSFDLWLVLATFSLVILYRYRKQL